MNNFNDKQWKVYYEAERIALKTMNDWLKWNSCHNQGMAQSHFSYFFFSALEQIAKMRRVTFLESSVSCPKINLRSRKSNLTNKIHSGILVDKGQQIDRGQQNATA